METFLLSFSIQASSCKSGICCLTQWTTPSWRCDRRGEEICTSKQRQSLKIGRSSGKCFYSVFSEGKQRQTPVILAVPQELDGLGLLEDSDAEDCEKEDSYLFRTELGGLVKVMVGATATKYIVRIEVLSLSTFGHDLQLRWGTFRSDPSQLVSLDSDVSVVGKNLGLEGRPGFLIAPFTQKAMGVHTAKLEFASSRAPFYLSFLLRGSGDAAASGSDIRTHHQKKFIVPVGIGRGNPMPLGVSFSNDGAVNFSLFSRNAEAVVLCLYSDTNETALEIALDPYLNRTGDIWHIAVPTLQSYASYGYRCNGSILWDMGSRFHMRYVLLDPYAKVLGGFSPDSGETVSLAKCLGILQQEPFFDWSGDIRPQLPMEKLVVYRLNVGLFTADTSSQLPKNLSGTFTGLIEKVNHFKNLGVNAILLEPIFSFDEEKGPYFPYHFFSPANIYGPEKNGVSAITSMKKMVRALHGNGIEVFLEVVFSHTAEGGDAACQMVTFRGIDNSSYYDVGGSVGSGTDNVLRCNNPIVQKLILDSLRYWVTEFHVDGFCFVNASSLLQGSNGSHLPRPPLVEAIALDPVLSKIKVIADCWSPLDMSYKEVQFPHWKRWAEMNTRFNNDVRKFLRGEGLLSDLATRLCGSGDVFSNGRGAAFSFNFIARNCGLSLVDLVSYSSNGLSSELSWNCGKEGPTSSSGILELRLRQIRNFLFILFISLGVPVLNMGDECGISRDGSPSYSKRGPYNWALLEAGFGTQISQFIAFLSSLRARRNDLLQVRKFLKAEKIEWQGNNQSQPNWEDPSCKFLCMVLRAEKDENQLASCKGDLFVAFNASGLTQSATLSQISDGYVWTRLVDTALPYPGFFPNGEVSNDYQNVGLTTYELMPHSCALFESKTSISSNGNC